MSSSSSENRDSVNAQLFRFAFRFFPLMGLVLAVFVVGILSLDAFLPTSPLLWIVLLFWSAFLVSGIVTIVDTLLEARGFNRTGPTYTIVAALGGQVALYFVIRDLWAPALSLAIPLFGFPLQVLLALGIFYILKSIFSRAGQRLSEGAGPVEQTPHPESEGTQAARLFGESVFATLPNLKFSRFILRIHPALLLMACGVLFLPVSSLGRSVAITGMVWWLFKHAQMFFHYFHVSPRRRYCLSSIASAQIASLCLTSLSSNSWSSTVIIVTMLIAIGPILYRPSWCRSLIRTLFTAVAGGAIALILRNRWLGMSHDHTWFRLLGVLSFSVGVGTAGFFAILFLTKLRQDVLRHLAPGAKRHGRWLPCRR